MERRNSNSNSNARLSTGLWPEWEPQRWRLHAAVGIWVGFRVRLPSPVSPRGARGRGGCPSRVKPRASGTFRRTLHGTFRGARNAWILRPTRATAAARSFPLLGLGLGFLIHIIHSQTKASDDHGEPGEPGGGRGREAAADGGDGGRQRRTVHPLRDARVEPGGRLAGRGGASCI